MKTKLFLFVICMCANAIYAQITFQHNFSTNYAINTTPFNTHNETMYWNIDQDPQIKLNLYRADYSLYRSIVIPILSGYEFYGNAGSISTRLFNLDDLIEFLISYRNISNPMDYKLILYDENLNIIKDFGNRSGGWAFKTMDNLTKFRASKVSYNSSNNSYICEDDFYLLPGTIPIPTEISEIQSPEISGLAFPNPANGFINLPYSLKPGEMSVMHIFDSKGMLVESFGIMGDQGFAKIMLNKYKPGSYVYQYNGVSNKFIVK